MTHSLSPVSISALRAGLSGRVITPGDADYDQARTLFMGGFDRRPAAIVRPVNTADVARVITMVRDAGAPLAVRSGGHSGAGHSSVDSGIVLDVRDMKSLQIDAGQRTAWAETGLTAGEYTTAAAVHGLATGFGDTASVGIGGITLAGGIGYLTRRHGLTIDSVIGAELVTAGGDVLRVDETSHPDLFWAIRGGGGNFGVVTRFHYRLHAVDRVVGGMLLLPATPDVIVNTIEAAEAAPDDVTAIVNVMPAPPMPFVPEAHHGQLAAMIMLCAAGDPAAAERAVAPFRAIAQPLADMVRPIRYPEMLPPDEEGYHPTAVGRTLFIERVDRFAAETMLDFLRRSDASVRVAQIRVLGGAMARVPADATAFAHRGNPILVNVAAFYDGPDDRPVRDGWTREFAAALHQGIDGAYSAFVNEDGDASVRRAYPEATRRRLAAVKARYDPTNVFRLNHNISPDRVRG